MPWPRPRAGARTWLAAIRVRQWPKNLLVFATPMAAGAFGRPGTLAAVAATCAVFCLLASGAYLINDVTDAEEDRRHPVKRHRPVASGALSPRRALGVAGVLLLGGLGGALSLGANLLGVAAGYALLNGLYTTWLRRIAYVDLGVIAGAFVLRVAAGSLVADAPMSAWLIVSVLSAAGFVAAGKRLADVLDPAARRSRAVLRRYDAGVLRHLVSLSCLLALGAYAAWAAQSNASWRTLTIVPLSLVLGRYRRLVITGHGGAPERVLFGDRGIQALVAIWLLTIGIGM